MDDGRIFLFRPQESGIRMQIGAKRMCMPSPSIQQFVDAVKLTTIANKRWVSKLFFFSQKKKYILLKRD